MKPSHLITGAGILGFALVVNSNNVLAESKAEINRKLEPLISKMALDLLMIDGIAEKEKKILFNSKGHAYLLTSTQRASLANEINPLLSNLEKEQAEAAASVIGMMLTLLVVDGVESSTELAALEEYRSILVPSLSMEHCRKIGLEHTKKMQGNVRRGEVPTNLKGIKTALIAYESMMDTYVSAELYPPLGSEPKRWKSDQSGGFNVIGWRPDGGVRGSYSVSTTRTNFIATGVIDADGDGRYATYVATKSENPKLMTPEDVY